MSIYEQRDHSDQGISYLEVKRFFSDVRTRIEQFEIKTIPGLSKLKLFFTEIRYKVEPQQRLLDQKKATDFNIFDFIGPDENKLSDVLAWLLDPKGTHGQNDLFLRLMFKQLKLNNSKTIIVDAKVLREAPTHGIKKFRRRMDILVEAGACLAIENKIDSLEQSEQVKDYLECLRRCARGRKTALVYLTPNGRQPYSLDHESLLKHKQNGQLHCWSYHVELHSWLEICRRECKAQRIKILLTDFIDHIESKLKREPEYEQERKGYEN